MSCGQARRLLWPGAGPRAMTSETVAAREHASGCEACQAFLQDMKEIGERVSHGAPRPSAPVEVRDRLFKAIARARIASDASAGATRSRRTLLAGVRAVLVLALGLVGYLTAKGGLSRSHDALDSIVEDRLRSQKGAGLISSDSLQVA